jgi:AraC-like DNA-binding protein
LPANGIRSELASSSPQDEAWRENDFVSGARPGTNDFRHALVERAAEVIKARYAEPLTLSDLASTTRTSPFYLNRIFREVTGAPPRRFLAAVRMAAAKQLLVATDLTITDLSYRVGYLSVTTFSAQFTRMVGLPPRELRRRLRTVADIKLSSLVDGPHESPANGHAPGRFQRGGVSRLFSPVALDGSAGLDSPMLTAFYAAFSGWVPQGVPIACGCASVPGPFELHGRTDYLVGLMACAYPGSSTVAESLMASNDQTYVARLHQLAPDSNDDIALVFTRAQPADPPIVYAAPLLRCSELSLPIQGRADCAD